MAGKRKQYTPEFKFKVVLESLQRDTTLEQVYRKYTVSSSMVSRWRQALHEIGPEIFCDQRDPKSRRKAREQNDILKKSERHCWANEQAAQNGGGAHAVCFRQSDQQKPAGTGVGHCAQ